jgi:acyl-CoA oxidase
MISQQISKSLIHFSGTDRGVTMRLGVHTLLFRTTIQEQGTDEQVKYWDSKAEKFQIFGCFGMTELGTSSYLRGIETTATYDKEHQQFVIHSPTLTATKFWIGMAGETATHCLVLAQLIINHQKKGLFWFIVNLRDPATGKPLPGVSVGDIGPKAGRPTLDNGWIQFSYLRIPRENMLMKWATVDKDGKFSAPADPSISYATLVGERVTLLEAVVKDVTPAMVITVRYGAVRKQGPTNCILDYQAHYSRLLPPIAFLFGVRFFTR